jgi:UDP-glucose 4-epimerase
MRQQVVIITGAQGFLGRHVAKAFHQEGAYVLGLGHGLWSQSEWNIWGLSEWYAGDVTIDNFLRCSRKPDVIVHCAGGGSVGFSMQNPAADFRRTVETTSQALEYMRVHALEAKFVYPSSAAVYGNAGTSPISENQPPAPVSPYGVHKHMAECLCRLYADQFGVKAAVVRLFSVYGPELRKQLLWDASKKLCQGNMEFPGTGAETRDWLHVHDAAALLLEAAKFADQSCPVVNGGRGEPVTVRHIIEILMKQLSITGEPIFSGETRKGDPKKLVADITSLKFWSWNATISLESGIAGYVSWLKENSKCV